MMKVDKLQLEIIIGSNEARKDLRKLEEQSKKLKKELKKLPEGTDEWHAKRNKLSEIESKMESLRHEIGLTGMTMKELARRQRELNSILSNMDPRTAKYRELSNELARVKKRQAELRGQSQKTNVSIKKLANGFNHYFGIVSAGVATITGVIIGFQQMITGSGELSDRLSDVQKTTNLTNSEIRQLNKELSYVNTRTSRKELLELSRIAGKLGVSGVDNIKGFVTEADQIVVALAEDLGGNVEETIRQVGKLVDIFNVKDEYGLEIGLRKVGSTINALGAASTANEPYLVEFAKRFGGIAPNADISIQDTLGLASTLDQLGQTTEVSTTALGKLMVLLGKDVAKYAGVAGMEVEEFSELLANDANEALIKVFEGSKSNKEGLEGMAEALETMGVDGQRAIGVIGVLSNNIELLRQEQDLANDEFKKGTSLSEEFSKKNENLAAILAKIKKRLYAKFVNTSLISMLERGARAVERWTRTDFADVVKDEQKRVNALAISLTNSNTPLNKRKSILKELKGINPDIVTGLDAENIEYAKLVTNLKNYNEQSMQRILLAKFNEEEAQHLKDINQLRSDQSSNLRNISQAMMKFNQEVALSDTELIDKISSTESVLKEKALVLGKTLKENTKIIDGSILETMEYQAAKKDYDEIVYFLSQISNYRQSEKDIQSADKLISKLQKEKDLLKEILQVKNVKVKDDIEDNENDDDNITTVIPISFFFDDKELEKKALEAYRKAEEFIENGFEKEQLLAENQIDLDAGDQEQLEKVRTNAMYEREIWESTYEGRIAAQKRMLRAGIIAENEYSDNVYAINKEKDETMLAMTADTLGALASIFAENTVAYKVLASAEAMINTYLSASKALAEGGPIMGPIMATAMTLQGLALVAKINGIGVDQAEFGRYDVIGMEDKKAYKGVPMYSGDGILNGGRPTLINEKGDELIINNAHLKNIQMNYPEVEQAIKSTYVPQRAAGNYTNTQTTAPAQTAGYDAKTLEVMERFVNTMDTVASKGVSANLEYRKFKEYESDIESTKLNASR